MTVPGVVVPRGDMKRLAVEIMRELGASATRSQFNDKCVERFGQTFYEQSYYNAKDTLRRQAKKAAVAAAAAAAPAAANVEHEALEKALGQQQNGAANMLLVVRETQALIKLVGDKKVLKDLIDLL